MMFRLCLLTLPLMVAACSASLPFGGRDQAEQPAVTVTEAPGDDVLRPRARLLTAAIEGDTAVQPVPEAASDGFLGETLAGLGSPAESGRWLSTGLVDRVRSGRVVTEDGRSLSVELRPSGAEPAAGSQISLAAMQTLGLHLAQLAALRVYVD